MSTVVCVTALVTDRMPHLPSARVALIESAKPGRRVELPGGKALSGEPPYMAARREMREELGIEVTNLEPLSTIHGEPRPGAEFASDIWVFRARADAERAELVAGDDAKQAFWASRGDVLELERNGCLSDLDSKPVLLEWARQGGPVERVTAEVLAAVSPPGEELVTRLAHGDDVREIIAREMGAAPTATLTGEWCHCRVETEEEQIARLTRERDAAVKERDEARFLAAGYVELPRGDAGMSRWCDIRNRGSEEGWMP